jgi:hypothetical protein
LNAFLFSLRALALVMIACRGRAEPATDIEKQPVETRGVAQPRPAQAGDAPAPPPKAPAGTRAAARDITVPPPDVDLHVINGRNILSAPLGEAGSTAKARAPSATRGRDAERVRVTFWTTPEGLKLPEPQQFEGALAELELGLGDLPMLSPGQKRRVWIPGPTGMATLDVELFAPSAPDDDDER